jgi:hypothetical protein
LAEARTYIEESKYKEALEAIGKTLANMLFELNTPVHITVGEVSTEEALLLSGRGIDPASFITMQKLLPVCSYGSEDVEWRTRGTGHEANWTYENALFCLETATQTILAIQSAPRIPNPYEFHDVYDDIVTIIADNPSILVTRGFVPFGSENEARLKKGDQVSGRAHGRISPPGESPSLSDVDFEFSEYVALDQPIHPSLGDEADSVFSFRTLWFKTSEVTLSSRSNGRLEQIRKWALEMRARNDDQALS